MQGKSKRDLSHCLDSPCLDLISITLLTLSILSYKVSLSPSFEVYLQVQLPPFLFTCTIPCITTLGMQDQLSFNLDIFTGQRSLVLCESYVLVTLVIIFLVGDYGCLSGGIVRDRMGV